MKEIIKSRFEKAVDDYKRKQEPVSVNNWYFNAASACEDVSDAILRDKNGASTKIAKGVAGKLGAAGTSVGVFSIASLLGTASTGTAIGSLSGAAFTSASLAWVGGSVFMGSIVLGVAAVAGGIGAVVGAGWVSKKYLYGKKREKTELEIKEQNIIDVCLSLAAAFHQQSETDKPIDSVSAKAIYGDALMPLCEDLLEINTKVNSWPYLARQRLSKAILNLKKITKHLGGFSKKHPNITIGIVSSVFLQMMSDNLSSFNQNEQLVLDALRRSNNQLTDASNEDLAEYIQSLEPSQLSGLHSNIKGIYHELRFAHEENTDDDEFIVEIFDATNHAGSDVKIINSTTGEINEFQLKATDYLSYIKKHNDKYDDISVLATNEVASQSADISSTGISNSELNQEVTGMFDRLDESDGGVISSMGVAAMVSLARNAKVLLRGNAMTREEKSKLVEEGMISAGVAGIVSLLIG